MMMVVRPFLVRHPKAMMVGYALHLAISVICAGLLIWFGVVEGTASYFVALTPIVLGALVFFTGPQIEHLIFAVVTRHWTVLVDRKHSFTEMENIHGSLAFFRLKPEVEVWAAEHCVGLIGIQTQFYEKTKERNIRFSNADDAFVFKMMWC